MKIEGRILYDLIICNELKEITIKSNLTYSTANEKYFLWN